MLDRAGVTNEIEFVKSLTDTELARLKAEAPEFVLFVDLGSGASERLSPLQAAVADHHHFGVDFPLHLNPRIFGLDGNRTLSGSGATYLIARALDPDNTDLAALAIVGAVGDLQDSDDGRLVGVNRFILEEGRARGVLDVSLDVRFFGRESRPLGKFLQFADNPAIPGVSGREDAAFRLLEGLGIRLREGVRMRRWIDLSQVEKRLIVTKLADELLSKGAPPGSVERLIGEAYSLPRETLGSHLHDAKEFATLLNSTARYARAEIGLAVGLGDRGEAYREALSLLRGHRGHLVSGLEHVRKAGIFERKNIQYFHAGSAIRDTVVGIVAGMMFNSEGVRRDIPMIAFANDEEGKVKVSARATRALTERGVNLSAAIGKAAATVDGAGGGHDVAAGATIPAGAEERFLDAMDAAVGEQLGLHAK
ncbi:MAG: DHH family phosphoesterase [Euryarchaeota archaeon]|nr:DHH family phosphoesterase [Euryarchaeota archaeon]